MIIWPVQRQWKCSLSDTSDKEGGLLRTDELAEKPLLVLLGAAGSGKTFEIEQMIERDKALHKDVRCGRLASLACDAQGLATALTRLSDGTRNNTTIYLDSVDESMVPDRCAALKLAEWIRNTLPATKPNLRIACRSAVWPQEVTIALQHTYGASNVMTAELQWLGEDDVRQAAEAEGVDVDGFVTEFARTGSPALSQHPLTLRMLLRIFRDSRTLPANRSELFAQGVCRLANEREERRSVGTDGDVQGDEILEVASWVACVTLLSGREVIDLNDDAEPGTVALAELTALSSFNSLLTTRRILALAASGLCEGRGIRQFRFGHRQFAEYLAGHTIAKLLLHQARSMLGSGLGWTHGVASPLRETAAFAAYENQAIAEWIADSDPLVIGQSGIADDKLLRRATLAFIKKFRTQQFVDSQIRTITTEVITLKYRDAAQDLEPILRERGPGSQDVLEFAINLSKEWGLHQLSDVLADLVLDPAAPEHPRVSAGYALAKIGTASAKRRLKPLAISGGESDPHRQLQGLALRCNWPENLTDAELLAALQPREDSSFTGAYEGFLIELDSQGFQADGDRAGGLQWATAYLARGEDYEPAVRIAKRIARAALRDLANPVVRERLAVLMLKASREYLDSPVSPIRHARSRKDGVDSSDDLPLKGCMEKRRVLLDEMTHLAKPDDHWWWHARETPHLLEAEDFPWLLGRAVDRSYPDSARRHYAELARVLFRIDDPACVEAWLDVHGQEPVCSVFNIPIVVELDSKASRESKRYWLEQKKYSQPKKPKLLAPLPKERIADLLDRCETKDFRFFHKLCVEMTLKDDSTHYGAQRLLVDTPGWEGATPQTRERIVAAAKQFLERDTESIKKALNTEFNSIDRSGMAAYWLIDSIDRQPVSATGSQEERSWLASRSEEWWNQWAWYIMRELHPNLMGEEEIPKILTIRTLLSRAPNQVRSHMLRLAGDTDPKSKNLFQSLLSLIREVGAPQLDELLTKIIDQGLVAHDRIGETADHVLRNGDIAASDVCIARLQSIADEVHITAEHPSVALSVAILNNASGPYWDQVLFLLETRPELRRMTLGAYAHSDHRRSRGKENEQATQELAPSQLGVLVRQLFYAFPPEADPERDGAYWVGPDDSGRDLRNQVLSALGDNGDIDAVNALRGLERDLGSKYPWLRRPRARAEREYRHARWNAVSPESVARVLSSGKSRLMRTSQDVLDGIVEAIEQYAASLRSVSPSPLEDLWNTASGAKPSPKLEERASDKLRDAIQEYFEARPVTTGREPQIRRRLVGKDAGGEAGSRIDVFVTVPAIGTVTGESIHIPIEVKRSSNNDVKTSLKSQLVNRYMSEIGADVGVYVVMWFDAPNMANGFAPKWPDIAAARKELAEQADVESNGERSVRALVVDCSLS